MKKLLAPLSLVFGLLLSGQPANAADHHPAPQRERVSARPLVHYVVAVLQLPQERAVLVQDALQAQPLQLRTPEQMANRLAAVLTPTEYGRLQQLADQVDGYESLRFLAAR